MKRATKSILTLATAGLASFIAIMPLYTCFFLLHQPKLPEEINDFRK